jgi:hypothetical protein
MKPQARLAIVHLLIWGVLAVYLNAYVRKQVEARYPLLANPARTAINSLEGSLDFGKTGDPPGRYVFKPVQQPGKPQVDSILKTNKPGEKSSWDVELTAGLYHVDAWVRALNKGENEATLKIGEQSMTFAWGPRRRERDQRIELDVALPRPASTVELIASRIGQKNLIVKAIVLTEAGVFAEANHRRRWAYAGATMAGLAVLLSAACWGQVLMRLLFRVDVPALVRLLLSTAAGLAMLGSVTTVLGIVQGFNLPVVILMLLAGVIAGGKRTMTTLGDLYKETAFIRRPGFTVGVAIVGGIMALATVAAYSPAVGVDPLIYHLPLAKWLIQDGGYQYHPYQVAWSWPHLVSNIFALGQSLYSDEYFRSATIIHALLGWLWIAVVYATGKTLFGRAAGLGAAVLCLAIESVIYQFGLALADLGVAFLAGSSLLALWIVLERWDQPGRMGRICFMSIIAGGAAICKLNGPTIAIALAIIVGLFAWRRSGIGAGVICFATVGLVALAAASPMYVRNWILFYSPIYPFGTFFANRDLHGGNFGSMFTNGLWPDYLAKNGFKVVYRWAIDYMKYRFAQEGFNPGPAFMAGAILFVGSGRLWWRRYWAVGLFALILMMFWFGISPLTRFGWPWMAALIILACAPLSERPIYLPRLMIPVFLLGLSVIPLLSESIHHPVTTWQVVRGAGDPHGYLARMEDFHVGDGYAPPLEGIRAANKMYHKGELPGRVLLDTNLVAYADFPSVPSLYYLIVRATQQEVWARSDGYPCLSMAGKVGGDDVVLNEFARLDVRHVLIKKNRPKPVAAADGTYGSAADVGRRYTNEDRFDVFIERWVREGLARRVEYGDSILYSLTDAALTRMAGGTRPTTSQPRAAMPVHATN